MKQHIDIKDAQQLSSENWKKLIKWKMKCEDVRGDLPVWWEMTIGEMIEFLMAHGYFEENSDLVGVPLHTVCNLNWEFNEELCDALWEAVKQILEKE